MSDCILIKTWATMDAYELSAISRYTLLYGIHEAADEIDRLTRELNEARAVVVRLHTPQPLSSWHEDIGNVLWWQYPICEPPFSGEPYDSDWPFDENDPSVYWIPLPDCDIINERCEAAEKARES